MKREEKNALSQQRILEAAMEEFSRKGYEGASLSTACAEKGISKGIVYHHYKDKDELYLRCVQLCFDAVTAALRQLPATLEEAKQIAAESSFLKEILPEGFLY